MSASSESQLRLVARSFSAVSHELAGPLQTAINALFVLEQRRDSVPAELTPSLHALEQAIDAMRVKIDRLVHLPQAFLATRQLISVGEVIELALQSLKGRRDQVSVVAAQGEQTCIDGNAAALALGELLLNALTAGAPVSLSASLEGRSLVLRVTNPGPGFPPAAIDPFEGAEGKTLGLGLAIAQAVAISHGGALTLTDEGGVSTATLSLVGANA